MWRKGQGHREGGAQGRPDRGRSCIGLIAILLAIPAQKLNVAFLVALAFAVAASANLPSIVYNMFWQALQHPRRGVEHLRRPDLLGGPGDLLADHVRQGLDPARQEPVAAADEHRHLVVPAGEPRASSRSRSGFLLGYLGIGDVKEPDAEERYNELEVRALTGAGSEAAVVH